MADLVRGFLYKVEEILSGSIESNKNLQEREKEIDRVKSEESIANKSNFETKLGK